MDCTQVRNLLSEHQDGALDAGAAAALAVHLRGCGECAGCAGSLLAVREALRSLPPEPAPPELLARVRAAVEGEERDARGGSARGGAVATRPFLSRFRIPLEAAAALVLFASVYWYQRTATLPVRPPSAPIAQAPAVQAPGAQTPEAQVPEAQAPEATRPVDISPEPSPGAPEVPASGIRLPRGNPKTARVEVPVAAKPRTWTAADLPTVAAVRASTGSERIVPVAPFPRPTADPAGWGAPAFEERQRPGAEEGAEFRLARSFAPPPSRLLRPLPYGRDIVVEVKPEHREGAEERIAGAALQLGGFFEWIDRDPGEEARSDSGTVRVILPEAAAVRFLEEMGRIGSIPPEGSSASTDRPPGPRPGTVAYAVRIRVR